MCFLSSNILVFPRKMTFSISRPGINLAIESQPGLKSTIFIPPASRIYWGQKSCNTTKFLHNSSLFKKAQLQENCINLITWRSTKAECSPTWSSTVGEKNWHFDHVPYLGVPKYFRIWLYKDRSSSICKVWFWQMNKQSSINYSNRTEKWKSRQ